MSVEFILVYWPEITKYDYILFIYITFLFYIDICRIGEKQV